MPHHPLTGVTVKLRNADHHLQRLYAATRAYLDSGTKPAGVVAQQDPSDRTRGYLRFKVATEPPLEIAAIAGDVVHNLRCSVDYIVEELVKCNGKRPGLSNQFPICTSPEGFAEAQRRGRLNGVSKSGIAAVKHHQPFEMKTKGAARPPLCFCTSCPITTSTTCLPSAP